MTPHQTTILILGAGYTGRRIAELARARGALVYGTSRTPDRLTWLPPEQRIPFDLARPETWRDVPDTTEVIWCLPAEPEEAVVAAAASLFHHRPRLAVFSTTSVYAVSDDAPSPPLIDESFPVTERPRVRGEEVLRRTYGAVVLRVSGIYGPGRHVLDWIRRGRVASSPRSVNLIHVDDLAAIALRALERGRPGEVYNVSDGRPRQWSEICREAQRRWGVPLPPDRLGPGGKRLSIEKLTRELGYQFQHPDLYEALEAIERASGVPREGEAGRPEATG